LLSLMLYQRAANYWKTFVGATQLIIFIVKRDCINKVEFCYWLDPSPWTRFFFKKKRCNIQPSWSQAVCDVMQWTSARVLYSLTSRGEYLFLFSWIINLLFFDMERWYALNKSLKNCYRKKLSTGFAGCFLKTISYNWKQE